MILNIISLLISIGVSAQAAPLVTIPGPFDSGKIAIPCSFDGNKEMCTLDSGSDRSNVPNGGSISSYSSLGPSYQHGASGVMNACDWVMIAQFQIGDSVLLNHPVSRCANSKPGAVIGVDAFLGKTIELNFDKKTFTADDTPISANPKRQGFLYTPAGLIVMPIKLNGLDIFALWDTGAGISSVDVAFAEAHPELFTKTGEVPNGTDSFGHPIKMTLYSIKSIQIGSKVFENVSAIGIDLSSVGEGLGANTKFILGYNIISRTNWNIDTKTRSWAVY